jgi:hypothetical protein
VKALAHAWDRFFFEPQGTRALGLFRISLGLITIYSFLLFAKDTTVFFSDRGILPQYVPDPAFEEPWAPSALRWATKPWQVKVVLGGLFLTAASFTAGFQTRLSAILLFWLVVSFQMRNELVMNSGDTVLRTMLFWMCFAPAGESLSLDAWLRVRRLSPGSPPPPPRLHAPWAQRMMQIQVAVIYLATALYKLSGPAYRDGSAMYFVLGLTDFSAPFLAHLMAYPWIWKPLTWGMLGAEFALPFLLWARRTRMLGLALGILLHGAIILFMQIPVFGILMIATYLPFLSEPEAQRLESWLLQRLPGRSGEVRMSGKTM